MGLQSTQTLHFVFLLDFLCGIRERARPDLHVGEENRGFKKQRRTEPKWDCETRGPRDRKLRRRHQLVLRSRFIVLGRISIFWLRFLFFCSALFFFFFGDVGFGYGFPVHSFGFFVWLLVVLMVVESRFVVGGGDETGFGCGFHVIHVESHG